MWCLEVRARERADIAIKCAPPKRNPGDVRLAAAIDGAQVRFRAIARCAQKCSLLWIGLYAEKVDGPLAGVVKAVDKRVLKVFRKRRIRRGDDGGRYTHRHLLGACR